MKTLNPEQILDNIDREMGQGVYHPSVDALVSGRVDRRSEVVQGVVIEKDGELVAIEERRQFPRFTCREREGWDGVERRRFPRVPFETPIFVEVVDDPPVEPLPIVPLAEDPQA